MASTSIMMARIVSARKDMLGLEVSVNLALLVHSPTLRKQLVFVPTLTNTSSLKGTLARIVGLIPSRTLMILTATASPDTLFPEVNVFLIAPLMLSPMPTDHACAQGEKYLTENNA